MNLRSLGAALAATLRSAAWAPLLVLLVHAPLSAAGFDLYDTHTWLDIPMHVLGGVAITAFFDRGLTELEAVAMLAPRRGRRRALALLACTLAAALGWELLELTADVLFAAGAQRGAADTLGDIANGLLGGGLWLVVRASRVRTEAHQAPIAAPEGIEEDPPRS